MVRSMRVLGRSSRSCRTRRPRTASWSAASRSGSISGGSVKRSSIRSAMRCQASSTSSAVSASRRAARAESRAAVRVASRALRAASSRSSRAISSSTRATMRRCSARGGSGTGCARTVDVASSCCFVVPVVSSAIESCTVGPLSHARRNRGSMIAGRSTVTCESATAIFVSGDGRNAPTRPTVPVPVEFQRRSPSRRRRSGPYSSRLEPWIPRDFDRSNPLHCMHF